MVGVGGREGGKDAAPLLSCTVITTDAVGELAQIHDRMPLALAEADWDAWLNPDAPLDPELLARPPDVSGIEMHQVSRLVNSVRNNGPELLEPVESESEQAGLFDALHRPVAVRRCRRCHRCRPWAAGYTTDGREVGAILSNRFP